MSVLLVTVSDDRFGRKESKYAETQAKIQSIFENSPEFGINRFLMMRWDDIVQTPFYDVNKVMLDNIDPARNGRCYKPFAIKQALGRIEEGDFIIYTDCSPEIWAPSLDRWKQLLSPEVTSDNGVDLSVVTDLCQRNAGILTALVKWDTRNIPKGHYGIHTHANFTTDRCMKKMGLERYSNSLMPASGMIVIQKRPETVALVDEWLLWNLDPECASLGDPSIPNDWSYWDFSEEYTKRGHRHDQSVIGLLLARESYNFVMPEYDIRFPGHNPLLYCRRGVEYEFMNPNDNPDTERRIRKGDIVINAKGIELTVFEIRAEYGVEWLIVGTHRESCYRTTADLITIKNPV